MNEKELLGAKKLIEIKEIKEGSYNFIGNSNITYADIRTLLDYIKNLEKEKQELIEYLKKEIEDLEKNKMDFSSDYYVDRKMFLKEILSKVEKR